MNDDQILPTTEIDDTTALLIKARSFLERGWCKGANARDKNGLAASSCDDQAVAWCVAGALFAAGVVPDDNCWQHPSVRRLQKECGVSAIQSFNDAQETVEPVLAAFDRAIATSKEPVGV